MIIKYSPVARKKLAQMKKTIGSDKVGIIVKAISDLKFNPVKCQSVERMLGISSRYYFLHIEHNYIFYRIEQECIFITDIYNEKEDFMWKMFRIKLRTDESIDYWGE